MLRTGHHTYLGGVVISLWRYRGLIWQMTKREVVGRYRGSMLGLLWSFFHPVLMLAVYTFVFGVVLQARWGIATDNQAAFAIILFSGMIVHSLFAECLTRAPGLILSNPSYVKKVVFPLEILPWVALGSALFHALVSLIVLLFFLLLIYGALPWTVILLPLIWAPLVLMTLGVSWFLASTGVYLRDVGQTVGIVSTVLLFLSPIFYPISALPEAYRPLLYANPLTLIIEQTRAVLIFGHLPDWGAWLSFASGAFVVAWAGYVWFQKTRKGLADVL